MLIHRIHQSFIRIIYQLLPLLFICCTFVGCEKKTNTSRQMNENATSEINRKVLSTRKMKVLYGFTKSLSCFTGRTVNDIIDSLKSWQIDAIFGGFQDTALVAALQQANIKVFAEAGIFVGERFWKDCQFARPVNANGEPIQKEQWYAGVNPVVTEVRENRLAYLEQLAREYPLDGIWLDFIRWPCHWEVPLPLLQQTSFDDYTLEKFQQARGIILPANLGAPQSKATWVLENQLEAWTAWKCQQITDFVKEARAVIKAVSENMMIGLFGVPWLPTDFNGAITQIIGQDYAQLAEYVDVFSPMVYHLMCQREVKWIADVTNWLAHTTRKPVWPIIQATDEPTPLRPVEFGSAIHSGLTAVGSRGIIIFRMKDLTPEKLVQMKMVFNQFQED